MWGEFCNTYSPSSEIEKLIEEICNDDKYNDYAIIFYKHEGIDDFKISVKEDINRPNNQEDYEVIEEYILNNFGYRDYDIIAIDLLNTVVL